MQEASPMDGVPQLAESESLDIQKDDRIKHVDEEDDSALLGPEETPDAHDNGELYEDGAQQDMLKLFDGKGRVLPDVPQDIVEEITELANGAEDEDVEVGEEEPGQDEEEVVEQVEESVGEEVSEALPEDVGVLQELLTEALSKQKVLQAELKRLKSRKARRGRTKKKITKKSKRKTKRKTSKRKTGKKKSKRKASKKLSRRKAAKKRRSVRKKSKRKTAKKARRGRTRKAPKAKRRSTKKRGRPRKAKTAKRKRVEETPVGRRSKRLAMSKNTQLDSAPTAGSVSPEGEFEQMRSEMFKALF